jgi:hypothetical protein
MVSALQSFLDFFFGYLQTTLKHFGVVDFQKFKIATNIDIISTVQVRHQSLTLIVFINNAEPTCRCPLWSSWATG